MLLENATLCSLMWETNFERECSLHYKRVLHVAFFMYFRRLLYFAFFSCTQGEIRVKVAYFNHHHFTLTYFLLAHVPDKFLFWDYINLYYRTILYVDDFSASEFRIIINPFSQMRLKLFVCRCTYNYLSPWNCFSVGQKAIIINLPSNASIYRYRRRYELKFLRFLTYLKSNF